MASTITRKRPSSMSLSKILELEEQEGKKNSTESAAGACAEGAAAAAAAAPRPPPGPRVDADLELAVIKLVGPLYYFCRLSENRCMYLFTDETYGRMIDVREWKQNDKGGLYPTQVGLRMPLARYV